MPRLLPGDDVYFEAFHTLSSARTLHMSGPNPIAVSEMLAYAQGLTWIDSMRGLHLFVRHVQNLDSVFLEFAADKAETERKRRTPSSKR
jgi:hypothetical protein